jgi:hypothetical protein
MATKVAVTSAIVDKNEVAAAANVTAKYLPTTWT